MTTVQPTRSKTSGGAGMSMRVCVVADSIGNLRRGMVAHRRCRVRDECPALSSTHVVLHAHAKGTINPAMRAQDSHTSSTVHRAQYSSVSSAHHATCTSHVRICLRTRVYLNTCDNSCSFIYLFCIPLRFIYLSITQPKFVHRGNVRRLLLTGGGSGQTQKVELAVSPCLRRRCLRRYVPHAGLVA